MSGSGSSRPSLQSLAAAKTIIAASSLQQKIQERRRRASDGDGSGGGGDEAQRQQQQQQRRRRRRRRRGDGDEEGGGSVDDSFWATSSSPSPPQPKPGTLPTDRSDQADSGDGSSTPGGGDGGGRADGKVYQEAFSSTGYPVVVSARALDDKESTATTGTPRAAEKPQGSRGGGEIALGDRAVCALAPAVAKKHVRGSTEPESFLGSGEGGGGGGGSGVMPQHGKQLIPRRRSSEVPTRFVS